MDIRNSKECNSSFIGADKICNNCKSDPAKNIDDITKLTGAIETLALLKSMKESNKIDKNI